MTGALSPGNVVAGRWQVQRTLGRGESGEVYVVDDAQGTGRFALKLFWASALDTPELWPAFQDTVRAVSSFRVESVTRAHDFGVDAALHRPFVVTELVTWPSLAERVRTHGVLTTAELSVALEAVARALDAAHGAAIVHRDLKPRNVFVAPENPHWVRVTDFGVSGLRAAAPPPPGWGATPAWTGPDAADPLLESAPSMDVFGLGLVAFFALAGQSPYRAARSASLDMAALWQELLTPFDSASQRAAELGQPLDAKLDPWFARVLSRSPDDRFRSASDAAREFAHLANSLQNKTPGIAAAIAAPLLFQPERAPASRPAEPARSAPPVSAARRNRPAPAADPAPSAVAPATRDVRLLVGLGAAVALLTAGLGAVLVGLRKTTSLEPAPSASTAPSLAPLAAVSVARVASASAPLVASSTPSPLPAPSVSAAPRAESAQARLRCFPGCDYIVCDGHALRDFDEPVELGAGSHTCIAAKYGFGSREYSFSLSPGESRAIDFSLSALQADLVRKPSPPAATTAARPRH